MVPSEFIAKKGHRECVVRSSGIEKKHLMVALSITADGQMLLPIIIFRGKTDQTIRNFNTPPGFIFKRRKGLDG